MECIFSVDVEDWFHILDLPSTPPLSKWDTLPSHVGDSFMKLLDILDEKNVTITCFFLGWVAEKFPELVKEAYKRGHEIASHGYSHRLIGDMSQDEFYIDINRSKNIIENITGEKIYGYRSPGFSITEETQWALDYLIEAGFLYDSSIFPISREQGGYKIRRYSPYVIERGSGSLVEFPLTVQKVMGIPLSFFGGGYLRVTPYILIKWMADNILKQGRPVLFFIHPREIDHDHPRLPMKIRRRIRSYVGLKTTRSKLSRILDEYEFVTFYEFTNKYKPVGASR